MRSRSQSEPLVMAVIFAVVGGFYLCLVQFRKRRFRAVAAALGATCEKSSFFSVGKIVGRDFSIELRRVGKSFRTFVSAPSADLSWAYLLKTPFFERFPDWKYAMGLAQKNERLFMATIGFLRYAPLDSAGQELLLRRLSRTSFDARRVYQALKSARVSSVTLEASSVTASFPGAMSNLRRLQETVEALRRISTAVA